MQQACHGLLVLHYPVFNNLEVRAVNAFVQAQWTVTRLKHCQTSENTVLLQSIPYEHGPYLTDTGFDSNKEFLPILSSPTPLLKIPFQFTMQNLGMIILLLGSFVC